VPDVRPLTTPEVPTVATPAFVLLHTPPLATSVKVVVNPAVRVAVPLIASASGEGLIVTVKVAAAVPQLFVTVYDMVVVPEVNPLTMPVVPTVATAPLVLLHTPPVDASVNNVDEPGHAAAVPLIKPAVGGGLTVTTWATAAVTLPFVTV
jgi:hypothetical protein